MAILIEYPWIAAVVVVMLAVLWRWRRRRIAGVAAAAWGLYAVYEYLMYLRVLCSGECNIRIDLLVIHPLLVLLTVAAVLASFMQRPGRTAAGAEGRKSQ
jgi:hypothetical protein